MKRSKHNKLLDNKYKFYLKDKISYKSYKFLEKKSKDFLILFIETIFTIIEKSLLINNEKYIYDINKRYDFNIYTL